MADDWNDVIGTVLHFLDKWLDGVVQFVVFCRTLVRRFSVGRPGCQGRRGDHQAEVCDNTWTMRVGEVGTDQHNTTLGNWRRDLTEGQSYVTCSDLRYPTEDMRGGGTTGGQEELWSQRSS